MDNEPNNIEQERKAFERLNFTSTHTESTDSAIRELKRGEYDLVISDFSRGNDDQAAFTLIDEMRKENIPTKVVIYTHHTSSEAKTRENPAYGVANSPRELLDLVLQAIQ